MNGGEGIAVVILAAGMGTRMKSEKAKVLHEIGGRSMLSYVLDTALGVAASDHIVVVVGCQAEAVRNEAAKKGNVRFAFQEKQLGTGHAVQSALASIPPVAEDVVKPRHQRLVLVLLRRRQQEGGRLARVVARPGLGHSDRRGVRRVLRDVVVALGTAFLDTASLPADGEHASDEAVEFGPALAFRSARPSVFRRPEN